MKQTGIIHPQLLELVAAAGHGDMIVVTDAGLKIPRHARRIDLGVTCGVPTVAQVVRALSSELVVEAATLASEFEDWNPEVCAEVRSLLEVVPDERPHADLMADMADQAYAYVKTGECTAYSSVVLHCGVNYLDDAVALYRSLHPDRPAPF